MRLIQGIVGHSRIFYEDSLEDYWFADQTVFVDSERFKVFGGGGNGS